MKTFLFLFFLTLPLFAGESFSTSKKELRKIYQGHQETLYCGCKFNYKDKKYMINKKSCGYEPRLPLTRKGKVNQRAKRIEWEHLIPAENFGRQFKCWREGAAKCVTSKGKRYKGRKCCTKVNKKYRLMQADMHNLFPAIGELNGDRKNFRFDFEEAQATQYGECKFSVDFKQKRASVKKELRGVIARNNLYFHRHYGMKLSKQEMKKYKAWNKQYKANTWEVERNKKIKKVQGNSNPFI